VINDMAQKTISTIKTSGSRLLNLINDILDAASMRQVWHRVQSTPQWCCGVRTVSTAQAQGCGGGQASCAHVWSLSPCLPVYDHIGLAVPAS
jgi:hypothetical protein